MLDPTLKISHFFKWVKDRGLSRASRIIRHEAFIIASIIIVMFSVLFFAIYHDTATISDEQYIELNQLIEKQPYLKYMVVDYVQEDGTILVKHFKLIKNKARLPFVYEGKVPKETSGD